jgi:hypothetical protein
VPPSQGNELIVGGTRVAVAFPVVTWEQPGGLSFYVPDAKGSWIPRKAASPKVDLLVLHWDGCTSSRLCYQVLLERRLSVHLLLDADGTVYQALDLAEAHAFHAAEVNERSVGVEICNPVRVERSRFCNPPRSVVWDRGVNGDPDHSHLEFYDVQKQRLVELAKAVSDIFEIPRRLPRLPEWTSHTGGLPDLSGTVTRGALDALASFTGTCGHFHVSSQKDDPGNTLWGNLTAAGWA